MYRVVVIVISSYNYIYNIIHFNYDVFLFGNSICDGDYLKLFSQWQSIMTTDYSYLMPTLILYQPVYLM